MAVAESEIELFGAKLGFKFFYNAFNKQPRQFRESFPLSIASLSLHHYHWNGSFGIQSPNWNSQLRLVGTLHAQIRSLEVEA